MFFHCSTVVGRVNEKPDYRRASEKYFFGNICPFDAGAPCQGVEYRFERRTAFVVPVVVLGAYR